MAKHKVKTEFPKFMFGPDGKGKIFKSADQIPAGWVESKGDLKSAPAVTQETKKSPKITPLAPPSEEKLSREEMIAHLDSKKITELWSMAKELGVDKKGKKPELIERLVEKLESAQE